MKIVNVVGARPNFMKIAPIIEEMRKFPGSISPMLVHTGQHYDDNMSRQFFKDLELPEPDVFLGVGPGTHAQQTAKIMVEFEKILVREKPDLTLVVGDVNSTLACALVSVKLNIPVAHVEAGLRSFDRAMPEEINRLMTDAISDYLFITEKEAEVNLLKEGKPKDKIFFVGNVMIDTLLKNKAKGDSSGILSELHLASKNYALLTLHRPENVDNEDKLKGLIDILNEIKKRITVVFPVHPRTKSKLDNLGVSANNGLKLTGPLGYLDFIKLMSEAKCVLTDSGGIQEETTILRVPCLTLRKNTERPATITQGSNMLLGTDREKILKEVMNVLKGKSTNSGIPELWDGQAAVRIVRILIELSGTNAFSQERC
ncbi:UDP-N-acetylglucosamine 2-epimerase (non-hydrolyzing) [bacterium]|nr:MAG: UDP-N-acetylglucosamine 2-epimerase (non-hydrolyzing) [bacterium]